ncbi:unnamed protein product [Closterium sp. Naga37s-1]|nr:unnamed protein product [Closterium sp. Naga37s-1]
MVRKELMQGGKVVMFDSTPLSTPFSKAPSSTLFNPIYSTCLTTVLRTHIPVGARPVLKAGGAAQGGTAQGGARRSWRCGRHHIAAAAGGAFEALRVLLTAPLTRDKAPLTLDKAPLKRDKLREYPAAPQRQPHSSAPTPTALPCRSHPRWLPGRDRGMGIGGMGGEA